MRSHGFSLPVVSFLYQIRQDIFYPIFLSTTIQNRATWAIRACANVFVRVVGVVACLFVVVCVYLYLRAETVKRCCRSLYRPLHCKVALDNARLVLLS